MSGLNNQLHKLRRYSRWSLHASTPPLFRSSVSPGHRDESGIEPVFSRVSLKENAPRMASNWRVPSQFCLVLSERSSRQYLDDSFKFAPRQCYLGLITARQPCLGLINWIN